ncbi:MAG: cbb3-type cytochrome oxidase subunit 3 [Alcanivoracaceae bacterium]
MDAINFNIIFTVAFFTAFMVMVIWVFLPRRKSRYDDAAQLPFVADQKESAREPQRHE